MGGVEALIESNPALGLMGATEGSSMLTMREQPLAMVVDPGRCSGITGRFGTPDAVLNMLGAMLSMRPTGMVALTKGSQGVAMRLQEGRLTASWGTSRCDGPRAWMAAFRELRWQIDPPRDENPLATYVAEHALDGLRQYTGVHACLSLLDGDIDWLGTELDAASAVDLSVLLLEHARRCDELPSLRQQLGPMTQIVVPVNEPARVILKPTASPAGRADWDFFDEPDHAAQTEWLDARQLFGCCDGTCTLQELVERSKLGTFRTMAAAVALLERGHIELTNSTGVVEPPTVQSSHKAA